MTLEEAAMIAGIIQSPARQSPYVNRAAAKFRRDYTLQEMAENGYITQEQADEAKKKPIVTRGQPQPVRSVAPFFTEEVRKYLEQKYGAKALYEGGLSVHTGVDIRLQRAANRAVDRGLRLVDKRRGYRRDKPNLLAQGHNLETYKHERWAQPIAEDDIVPAVVMNVSPASARVRIGEQIAELRGEGIAWGRRAPPALFKVGDLIEVRVTKIGSTGENRPPSRSSRLRSSKARSSPSTTAPARFARWSAGSASIEASSTARRRRTGRWDRSSSPSCTRPPSIADTRRHPSSSTSPRPGSLGLDSRRISPGTTTGSTRGASRCGTRWKIRGTCPR